MSQKHWVSDVNLQLTIMSNYFADSTLAELMDQYELSYERLTEIYAEIVKILNFWRNKEISYQTTI